ncbi:MAG: hypothetical protein ACKOEO_27190 [Planctomycetaceae bacterium]
MSSHEFTPDEVEAVRQLRGFAIDWPVIAHRLGKTVAQCRAAIGMPAMQEPSGKPSPRPWHEEPQQMRLF